MIELSKTPDGHFALYQKDHPHRLNYHEFIELLKYLRSSFRAYFDPHHYGNEQSAWIFIASENHLKTAIQQFLYHR